MVVHAATTAHEYAGLVWLTALFALLLSVPTRVFADQSIPPEVSLGGVVRDTTGLVLPGAAVELRPRERAPMRSTVSAADGTFVFPNVRAGPYRLRVSFPEFESFDHALTVDASSRPLIVVLALSGLQEHVSVEATVDVPVAATM